MSEAEAKHVLTNTVVTWDNNPDDLGKVVGKSPSGFFVVWETGQRGWIDFKDAKRVSLYTPKETN